MEDVVFGSVTQWGPLGILVMFAIYIIYNHVKGIIDSKSNNNKEYKNITHDTDIIITQFNLLKGDISTTMELINSRIESLRETFNHKHEVLNKRLVNLEDEVKHQPSHVIDKIEEYNIKNLDKHTEMLLRQVEMGPKIHRILGRYLDIIECDHIVLGAFHNGTATLNGIPYCKFDIVSEKYNSNKTHYDVEFAPMYRNVDILLHNKLPSMLFQNGYLHFDINPDTNESILDDVDDILYRRLLGRGISQISLNILKDDKSIPIGFIGCIKYDTSSMVEREIPACAKEIENVYNEHSKKI